MKDEEEMEQIVRLFTEVQECKDKRAAFLKGALFGLGFTEVREPNWEIIKKLISQGKDPINWIGIERDNIDIYKKVRQKQIMQIESMLEKGSG